MHGNEPPAAVEICLSAKSTDRKRLSRKGQDGSRPKRDNNARMDQLQFLIQPPAVMLHFRRRRLLVDAPFAALPELEVLDSIGHVHRVTVDTCVRQRSVEQQAGGPDKRSALLILLVAGLLADQRNRRANRAFAEHGARHRAPEAWPMISRRSVPSAISLSHGQGPLAET